MERVLLVGEEVQVRETLTLHCGTPYEIIQAATATEALTIVGRRPVDVVILEYRLPDCSGLELLAQIKTALPRLPVIMITAYGSEWVCASALKFGARDYFVKPCDPAGLVTSVRSILSAASRDSIGRTVGRKNVLAAHECTHKLLVHQPAHPPFMMDRDELAVQDAARFIQEHYWEPISLPQVAQQAGMSKFALSRKFKGVMKVPFRRYLVQLRVMKARALLQASRYSITEVAQMVGFGDLPRFDKVFKSFVGMPPSTYRHISTSPRRSKE